MREAEVAGVCFSLSISFS